MAREKQFRDYRIKVDALKEAGYSIQSIIDYFRAREEVHYVFFSPRAEFDTQREDFSYEHVVRPAELHIFNRYPYQLPADLKGIISDECSSGSLSWYLSYLKQNGYVTQLYHYYPREAKRVVTIPDNLK